MKKSKINVTFLCLIIPLIFWIEVVSACSMSYNYDKDYHSTSAGYYSGYTMPNISDIPGSNLSLGTVNYTILNLREFLDELSRDENFKDINDYAMELGYNYTLIPTKMTLDDGTILTSTMMLSSNKNFIFLIRFSSLNQSNSMLMKIDNNSLSLFDRDGGIVFNFTDNSTSAWSTHNSCSVWKCMLQCKGREFYNDFWNQILELAGTSLNCYLCVQACGTVCGASLLYPPLIPACVGCIGYFCTGCIGIPTGKPGLPGMWDFIKNCLNKCKAPYDHGDYYYEGNECYPLSDGFEKTECTSESYKDYYGNIYWNDAVRHITCVDCEWDENTVYLESCNPEKEYCIQTDAWTAKCSPCCIGNEDCDDNDECTIDECRETYRPDYDVYCGKCSHKPIDCDDNDPCTSDFCKRSGGCQNVPTPGCDHHPDDSFDYTIYSGTIETPSKEIAILMNGYVISIAKILAEYNHSATFLEVNSSLEDLNTYPVLIIPTGGLYGLDSPQFKLKLEQYIKSGGTLITFTQETGKDFEIIPGNLSGNGYSQDLSCLYAGAFIDTYHPILSGQDSIVLDINLDGYFTKYPENSTVLIRRTSNFLPAILMYGFGEGKVIATTAYSDWAYAQGSITEDERNLIRDLITWAKDQKEMKNYKVGDTTDIPIKITNPIVPHFYYPGVNYTEINLGDTINMRINVTNYGNRTSEKTSLIVYDSDFDVMDITNISDVIAVNESRIINISYTTSNSSKRGIWWIGYSLYDASDTEIYTGFGGAFTVGVIAKEDIGDNLTIKNVIFAVKDPIGNIAYVNVSTSIPLGETKVINLRYTIPRYEAPDFTHNLGIWAIDYYLYTKDNLTQIVYDAEIFSVSKFEKSDHGFSYAGSMLSFNIISDYYYYAVGSNATFTAYIYNDGTEDRTLRYHVGGTDTQGFSSLDNLGYHMGGQTVSVPAQSENTITKTVSVTRVGGNAIGFIFYDNESNENVGYTGKDYWVFGHQYYEYAYCFEITPPANLSYSIGENATITFRVKNTCLEARNVTLRLFVPGIFDDTNSATLAWNEEKNIGFTFLIPVDLEERNYKAFYGIGEPIEELSFFVRGAKLSVDARLDKKIYKKNETALLTINITNEREFNLGYYADVKLNQYEEIKNFNLSGYESKILRFNVPVSFTGKKLYYAIHFSSGRSIYINSMYVHEDKFNTEGISFYTDKQLYYSAEEVTIYVNVNRTDNITINAPGYSRKSKINGTRVFEFTLANELRSGSYSIDYEFGNYSSSYGFDVIGYSAVIKEFSLDKGSYATGENINAKLNLDLNRNLSGFMKLEIYSLEGNFIDESVIPMSFLEGENRINISKELTTDECGIHSFRVEIYLNNSNQLLLANARKYFEAETNSSIAGFVTDINENPVVNAIVSASGLYYGYDYTNENGSYLITGICAGTYNVWVSPLEDVNVLEKSKGINVSIGQSIANFTLLPGGVITGIVKDEYGLPVANVGVSASGHSYGFATTNASGEYKIIKLRNGTYEVFASPSYDVNLLGNSSYVSVTEGNINYVNITVTAGRILTGRVKDPNNNPVANAHVSLSNAEYRSTTTNANGSYIFRGLSTGTYNIYASPPYDANLLVNSTQVIITANETHLDITLPRGSGIAGYVLSQNGAVFNAYISVSGPGYGYAETDNNGYYLIPRLQPGTYNVYVSPPYDSNLFENSTQVEVLQGETTNTNITLPLGGIIRGYVTGSGPVVNAHIEVSGPRYSYAYTDEDGSYNLTKLDAGTYGVSVTPPYDSNFIETSRMVDVILSETTEANFSLSEGGIISGFVKDQNENPIANAQLSASGIWCGNYYDQVECESHPECWWNSTMNWCEGEEPSYGSTSSSADGSYAIKKLKNGSYNVYVYPPYESNAFEDSATADVIAGEVAELNFTLQRGGAITGMISDYNGTPVVDAQLSIIGPSYGFAFTDADGNYGVFRLQSGAYTINVYPPYGTNLLKNSTQRNVTVGETVTVDIILLKGGSITGSVKDINGTPIVNAQVSANSIPCYTYYTQLECESYLGCSWQSMEGGQCNGSFSCGIFNDTECSSYSMYGCLWDLGWCNESFSCDILNETECNAHSPYCWWNYEMSVCSGGTFLCNEHYDQSSCEADAAYGCSWNTGSCDGTVFCSSFMDQSLCKDNTVYGCSWQESGECIGEVSSGYSSTDNNGRYEVIALQTRTYNVSVTSPYYVNLLDTSSITNVTAGEETELNFTLGTGGILKGMIKDENGNPVEWASISFTGPSSGSAFTEENGSYELIKLKTGTYNVSVDVYGYLPAKKAVNVTAGEIAELNFTLVYGTLIRSGSKYSYGYVDYDIDADNESFTGRELYFNGSASVDCSYYGYAECETHPGCVWNVSPEAGWCSGSFSCSIFNESQCSVYSMYGCFLQPGECNGSFSCSLLNEMECYDHMMFCLWDGSSCSGTFLCNEHYVQESCEADAAYGCSWNTGSCDGTVYCDMSFYEKTSCEANAAYGCSWETDPMMGSCTGAIQGYANLTIAEGILHTEYHETKTIRDCISGLSNGTTDEKLINDYQTVCIKTTEGNYAILTNIYTNDAMGEGSFHYELYNIPLVCDYSNITLNLAKGWNLISIPLILEDNSVNTVFESINYSQIFSYDSKWKTPTAINNTMGLWIKVENDSTLVVEGIEPENTSISLDNGWNLIGYPSLNERNVSLVFEDINNSLINILSYENNQWFSYSPLKNNSLNSLKIIKQGYGYWVNVDDNVSLVIS